MMDHNESGISTVKFRDNKPEMQWFQLNISKKENIIKKIRNAVTLRLIKRHTSEP
jgi:hypothetical protein